MSKLDKLIKLNKLEKENRNNRLEDKQTKMIEQTRNKALVMSNEALMKPDGEASVKPFNGWTESDEAIEETQDIAPVYVDTKTAKILHLMGAQSNPQLKLDLIDITTRSYKKNKVDITLEQGASIVKDNIYEFSEVFVNYLTNPNVTYCDIHEDENKIKRFLFDIGYDLGKGEKRSSRYRTIKLILGDGEKIYGRGLTEDKLDKHDNNDNHDNHDNHSCNSSNNLAERLELLILELETFHNGLYDEMLNISKQLLLMNNINKEQLDDFVFNYFI